MAQTRIVPDNSIMVPAFTRETGSLAGIAIDFTRLSKPVADAIRLHRLKAFAPDQLQVEFLRVIRDKALGRERANHIPIEAARDAVRSFWQLPITYLPSKQLAEEAERLTFEGQLSADDSWYVATAKMARAELWVSHEHADQLVELTRRQGIVVRILSRERY
jgi:predicted nucleic acid-binding protein